jgi:hypothetical protein
VLMMIVLVEKPKSSKPKNGYEEYLFLVRGLADYFLSALYISSADSMGCFVCLYPLIYLNYIKDADL